MVNLNAKRKGNIPFIRKDKSKIEVKPTIIPLERSFCKVHSFQGRKQFLFLYEEGKFIIHHEYISKNYEGPSHGSLMNIRKGKLIVGVTEPIINFFDIRPPTIRFILDQRFFD